MPPLETARLLVRPFIMEDLREVHRLLDIDLHDADPSTDKMESQAARAQWLQWTVINYTQLARLRQPPYGDRAVVLKANGHLIGACGFVPCLAPFDQLPTFASSATSSNRGRYSTEVGLFYAISPAQQRQGYATEAAKAIIDYAFRHLHLKRIVATTTYDNAASIGVMRKLGMHVEKNSRPEPPWLQVVGVLENSLKI